MRRAALWSVRLGTPSAAERGGREAPVWVCVYTQLGARRQWGAVSHEPLLPEGLAGAGVWRQRGGRPLTSVFRQ